MNLWWVLLGTFFAALVAPIFWLLFIALLAVAIFKAAIAQKTVPSTEGTEDSYPTELPSKAEPSQEEPPFSVHQEATPGLDQVQPLLTQAVTHKKAKEWDEALACLDEAYRLAAQQNYDCMEWSNYLRLPAYLQLAGRNDEAWGWLNKFACGELPYREQSTDMAVQLGWRSMVSDKMRLFLEREKKFKPALIQRSVTAYLDSARAFRRVVDVSQEVETKAWLNRWTDPALKKMEKDRILQNYEHAQKSAINHGIPALTEELFKTAKKAKLSIEATEEIATLVFAMASDVTSELQAVARVAGVMGNVRAKLDELDPE